jgi:hypothetical protein
MNRYSPFILPVTIESRRIVFLDLDVHPQLSATNANPGEDVFIIDMPSMNTHTLFSINKGKFIQSLLNDQDDLAIKNLHCHAQYNSTERILEFILSPAAPANPSAAIELTTGVSLSIQSNTEQFLVELALKPGHATLTWDHLFVSFILELDQAGPKYNAVTKFYLAEKTDIKFAGLDFGSEASQMYYGEHTYNNKMNKQPINLFSAIKDYLDVNENVEDWNYMQYEEGGNFFKSMFFANKTLRPVNNVFLGDDIYSLVDSINIITKKANMDASFLNDKVQVPNLKLIHGNQDYFNRINFKLAFRGNTTDQSIYSIKDSIYASLLQNMIGAFLKNKINREIYLRFCVLVPNIYDIHEITHIKQIIRRIITELDKSKHIKAVEITNLSESDASFLGCASNQELNAGKYYIIIDCGKGTTDFSVMQSEQENKIVFKPIYRNGIAGAGNLISFAIFQSIVHHITTMVDEGLKKNVNTYFKKMLSSGTLNANIYQLYGLIETWKKKYNSDKTKAEIEKIWREAKTGDRTLPELFVSDPLNVEVLDLLNTITHVYDWNDFVSTALTDLVNSVHKNLDPIIKYLKQKSNSECAGILLTGRAFHFSPLKNLMLDRLRTIDGMKNAVLLNEKDFLDKGENFLKEVCMQGIFEKRIRTYSDVASTPIELKIGTMDIMLRKSLKKNDLISKIFSFIKKQAGADEVEQYDQESNNLKVINLDLPNMQFLASGKIMHPEETENTKIKEAYLIQGRSGIHLRIKNEDNKMKVIHIKEADQTITGFQIINIKKSLFPGLLDSDLLYKK